MAGGRRERDVVRSTQLATGRADEVARAVVVEQDGTLTRVNDRLGRVSVRLGPDPIAVAHRAEIVRPGGILLEVEQKVDVEEDVGEAGNSGDVTLPVQHGHQRRVVFSRSRNYHLVSVDHDDISAQIHCVRRKTYPPPRQCAIAMSNLNR